MELTFYIWENDTEAGPYTLDQMRSIWSTGRITLNSIVRQDTDGEWKTAHRAFGWRFLNQQENWLKEKDRQKGTEKL